MGRSAEQQMQDKATHANAVLTAEARMLETECGPGIVFATLINVAMATAINARICPHCVQGYLINILHDLNRGPPPRRKALDASDPL